MVESHVRASGSLTTLFLLLKSSLYYLVSPLLLPLMSLPLLYFTSFIVIVMFQGYLSFMTDEVAMLCLQKIPILQSCIPSSWLIYPLWHHFCDIPEPQLCAGFFSNHQNVVSYKQAFYSQYFSLDMVSIRKHFFPGSVRSVLKGT